MLIFFVSFIFLIGKGNVCNKFFEGGDTAFIMPFVAPIKIRNALHRRDGAARGNKSVKSFS